MHIYKHIHTYIHICIYVHIQTHCCTHLETAGHSCFISDNEIRFTDKKDLSDPTMHEDFWIDTLKTHYPLGLNNINPIQQVFFNIFISFHCITGNIYFCFFVIGLFYERESQSTFYFCFPYMLLLHMEPWDPPQNTLVSLHRVTCLLVIVTFIQVY